jgi:starch phosphorylase
MEKYFHRYWESLGLSREAFFKLGMNPVAPNAGFNMAVFALKMCRFANAVSQKHLEVTKNMWHMLWPDKKVEEIPIFHVSNGVHVPTWVDPKMGLLFDSHMGRDWLEYHDDKKTFHNVQNIPDQELWELHIWLKTKLFNILRERARRRWAKDKVPASLGLAQGAFLDPFVLTLGFAMRFAAYKRADLILSDPERLKRIICNPLRPAQIIFAGKAHPDDSLGKRILQSVFNVAKDPNFCGRIAFVEDYGEQTAQYLVHGVDAWLNNPIPPLEASGTSGMKAALNGIPNLSILDGWWVEGFTGQNGWAFGSEKPSEDRDRVDAEALYKTLEEQVIPLYYDVGEDGIPHGWVAMMKEAIKTCAPTFSARRMLKEYAKRAYIPALSALLGVGEGR